MAVVGSASGLMMILMKVLPAVPGHFDRYEWLALGIWVCIGYSATAKKKSFSRAGNDLPAGWSKASVAESLQRICCRRMRRRNHGKQHAEGVKKISSSVLSSGRPFTDCGHKLRVSLSTSSSPTATSSTAPGRRGIRGRCGIRDGQIAAIGSLERCTAYAHDRCARWSSHRASSTCWASPR